jgi:hypothetical protein
MTTIVTRMTRSKYKIFYSNDIYFHLSFIEKKYWSLIKNHISEQLACEPDIETKNRKPLMDSTINDRWELRFGPQNCFRVFYKIDYMNLEVLILAIGFKIKEKLFIGKEEIKL